MLTLYPVADSVKVLFYSRILWGLASSFVRLSVLCLYYRLLYQCHGHRYRWILHATTIGNALFLVANTLTSVFGCL